MLPLPQLHGIHVQLLGYVRSHEVEAVRVGVHEPVVDLLGRRDGLVPGVGRDEHAHGEVHGLALLWLQVHVANNIVNQHGPSPFHGSPSRELPVEGVQHQFGDLSLPGVASLRGLHLDGIPMLYVVLEHVIVALELVAASPVDVLDVVLLADQVPVDGADRERHLSATVLDVVRGLESHVLLELDAGDVVRLDLEAARHLRHPEIEPLVGHVLPAEPDGVPVRETLSVAGCHDRGVQAVHVEHDALSQGLPLELRVDVGEPSAVCHADECIHLRVKLGVNPAELPRAAQRLLVVVEGVGASRHLGQLLLQERVHDH